MLIHLNYLNGDKGNKEMSNVMLNLDDIHIQIHKKKKEKKKVLG